MTDSDNPTPNPSAPTSQVPEVSAKRRRRRVPLLLKIVGGLFLLIILLVVFAPMLASTGPARSFVLGKVNSSLSGGGRVEIADWSLGWLSGTKLNGVHWSDAAGQDVSIASLTTSLSVLDIVRGKYALGDTVVDGLDFKLRRPAETTPAQPSPNPSDKPKSESPPSPKPQEKPTSKLPDVSGKITIRNSKGSFEDVAKHQIVQFPSIAGTVNVPSINQPIENALDVTAVGPDGKQGTLKIAGTADVIENNEVHIDQANVDETITVGGFAMSSVAAMLPPGGIDRLEGAMDATIKLNFTAGQKGVLQANLTTSKFAAGGPALKGDTFAARELSIVIPPTTIDLSPGHGGQWLDMPIRTGGDKPQAITVTVRHNRYDDTIALGVNATPRSLMNFAGNLKPGATGDVSLNAAVDVGGLAAQMPNLFAPQQGRRLTSGKLEKTVAVKFAPDSASVVQNLNLKDLAIASADGAVERLQPVQQELRFTSLGGGWAMPELRDIRLALDSSFAKAEFGGKELTQLKGTADGDLAKMQHDLGPILAIADATLGGTFHVELNSTGDVTTATAPLDLSLLATLTNLKVSERTQAYTRIDAGAKVVRGSGGVEALNGVHVDARTGRSERELALDTRLTADVKYVESKQTNSASGQVETVRVAEVPRYTIERLNVDLAEAQREFASAPSDTRIDAGTLVMTGSGSYAGGAAAFDVKGGITGLSVSRTGATAPILTNYALTLDAAGRHADAGTRLTRLNVADNQKMLAVRQGNGEIVIPASDEQAPAGEIVLGVDVKRLLDVVRAAGGSAPPTPDASQLTAGRVDGTLKLAAATGPEKMISLTGQLDASDLTVHTPQGEPVKDERLAIKPSIRVSRDLSVINIDALNIDGRLLSAKVSNAVVEKNVVQKANATIDVPRLGDVHALWLAISPPEKPAEAGRIRGGSANVRLAVARQGETTVVTPEIDVKSLSVGAGKMSRDVGDVTVRGSAQLAGADGMTIPTLAIKGAGADLRLEKPLVVKNVGASSQLSALLSGRVNLAELCGTLEAWQGAEPGTAYPYAGDLTLRQELSTAPGGAISLVGNADIKQFATTGKGAGGRFAEPEITFVNQLNLDQTAKVLKIDRLTFATETTGALRAAATGTIRDYDSARTLDKLVLELDYDAKPLWSILRPLMDPETGGKSLEEFALAGKRKETIEVTGSYPVNDPHAITKVHATGGFALDTLSGRGLTVAQLDLRFLLDQGILRLQHPAGKDNEIPGARCNDSGVLSFHNCTVDLIGDHPRLNTPDNHPLIRDVSINPVLADSLLGRFVNPTFSNASQAKGVLNVTVVSCRGLGLDKSMQSPDPRESGRAELRWTLDDLLISQPDVIGLIAKLKPNALNENGISGAVKDGHVVIEAGQVKTDNSFTVADKYAVKFNGGIGLAENGLKNFSATLPPELFTAIDRNFGQYAPREGYRIQLAGTTQNWSKSVTDSLLPIVADLGVRAGLGSALGKALGGDRDKKEPRANAREGEPAAPRPAPNARESDPLENLLDKAIGGGGGNRETDAEKAARRERTREQRREREAKQQQQAPATTQPTTATTQPRLTKKEQERLRNEQKRKEKQQREQEKKNQRDKP